jgi:hypothetical protein
MQGTPSRVIRVLLVDGALTRSPGLPFDRRLVQGPAARPVKFHRPVIASSHAVTEYPNGRRA